MKAAWSSDGPIDLVNGFPSNVPLIAEITWRSQKTRTTLTELVLLWSDMPPRRLPEMILSSKDGATTPRSAEMLVHNKVPN